VDNSRPLADLYDPLAMPQALQTAPGAPHRAAGRGSEGQVSAKEVVSYALACVRLAVRSSLPRCSAIFCSRRCQKRTIGLAMKTEL